MPGDEAHGRPRELLLLIDFAPGGLGDLVDFGVQLPAQGQYRLAHAVLELLDRPL